VLMIVWVLVVSIALLARAYPRIDGRDEAHTREGAPDRPAPSAP
jgi:hypothetical protein